MLIASMSYTLEDVAGEDGGEVLFLLIKDKNLRLLSQKLWSELTGSLSSPLFPSLDIFGLHFWLFLLSILNS